MRINETWAAVKACATQSLTSVLKALRALAGVTGMVLVLVGAMLLGVAGSWSCAPNVRLTAWEIPLSEELKTCPAEKLPPADELAEVIDLLNDAQVHSLRQTMRLKSCEDKNTILIQLIEDHNRRVRALDNRPWWERLFG